MAQITGELIPFLNMPHRLFLLTPNPLHVHPDRFNSLDQCLNFHQQTCTFGGFYGLPFLDYQVFRTEGNCVCYDTGKFGVSGILKMNNGEYYILLIKKSLKLNA